ncbi:hypothetical protein [Rhodococcus sp. LB1]|uniref:hypothetical protein n=1 Tax=Rhodococcus sp. LB1 TaxID=1807499 RepID=UPI00077A140C|nr:hypothetical protein [Rhodococcus sp. LB1]KXX56530.1 hypothetical protein AZG88_49160 [Rhodococcus sp. LB1]
MDNQETVSNFGPELIFAIVRPVGVDRDVVVDAFRRQLATFEYDLEHIRISETIENLLPDGVELPRKTYEKTDALIKHGDRICEENKSSAALAASAIVQIQVLRAEHGCSETERRQRTAYLIDSVKRTQEVELLKSVYGDRFIQIALMSDDVKRRTRLVELFRTENFGDPDSEHDEKATRLMGRDQKEGTKYGQNVSKVFPKSDLFIDADQNVDDQLERFLNLLFGSPEYSPPSKLEFGMNMAYIASTRSPELGLKVGAAILDRNWHVLSLGFNAHPTNPQESPLFDRSKSSIKALVLDTLRRMEPLLIEEVKEGLDRDPEDFVTELLQNGELKESQLQDLTEFQIPVHAEMSALLDGLGRGGIGEGDTLYVTAYPCHNCAKHVMSANLDVVYLEPYPKSRAENMYGSGTQKFKPFFGISPKRYDTLFRVEGDRKDAEGSRSPWSREERRQALPKVGRFDEFVGSESERETAAISEELSAADI